MAINRYLIQIVIEKIRIRQLKEGSMTTSENFDTVESLSDHVLQKV